MSIAVYVSRIRIRWLSLKANLDRSKMPTLPSKQDGLKIFLIGDAKNQRHGFQIGLTDALVDAGLCVARILNHQLLKMLSQPFVAIEWPQKWPDIWKTKKNQSADSKPKA